MGTHKHSETHRYAAFISYAHADEAMAARLHKALETYPVPRHLRAQGKTTKPVFRDIAELTAAHSLSEKIREAVKGSRVLIVLCSPAAKASHWVNEEIKLFRAIHGDAAILSAIIEGTPETAFPAALTEGGREPLAAALGADKTGFKLGVTQLAAGMLGTGLDDLVQRGAKRRQKIMGAGLAASLALSGVMGFATLQAVEARKEAESARGDAEGLVEYMIKDLKFKLEPVGRLDLLEGIGDKAVEYYDKQDIKQLPDDSLTRQAAARQVLAQVALDAGRMEEAQKEIEAAADLTREVLARNPEDTDAIFAHAQSEFWVGHYYRRQGKLVKAEKPWQEYDRLAQVLYKKDSTNFDWVMEAGWGKNNLASLARYSYRQELTPIASNEFSKSIQYFKEALRLNSNSKDAQMALADSMNGKAAMLLAFEVMQTSQVSKLDHLTLLRKLAVEYPNDVKIIGDLYLAETDYYNGYFLKLGDIERQSLSMALDQLFMLSEYDADNLVKKDYFLQAVCNNFENLKLAELVLRKKQMESLLKGSKKNSKLNIGYYFSMMRVFEARIDFLREGEEDALEKLKTLGDNYLNNKIQSPDDWKLLYFIFSQHQAMGNQNLARKFARLFLEEINEQSNLNFPTIVFRKLKAQSFLKNCIAVLPLAQNLRARGYFEDIKLDLKHCNMP